MVMAITITTEARGLKSNNNIERVLLYGQKQHLCVGTTQEHIFLGIL